MRIFKNKVFNKWAEKEGLNDDTLRTAVDEMERGLIDADLGGHVMKKRVAKNVRANVSTDELKALKRLAKELMSYSDKALTKAIQHGALIKVEDNG